MYDAHVHMGYYARCGHDVPFYYSPRRIIGVLDRCGVDEFIASSTCSQLATIRIDDMLREANEVKQLAGTRAHVFFWLSGHLFDEDSSMSWMESGLFEGVKLHELETPWLKNRRRQLTNILDKVSEKGWKVQFHAGEGDGCRPRQLAEIARDYPQVHFDFAHCRPLAEMASVIVENENVWTDTAYFNDSMFADLRSFDWRGRLMFGTDLPVWQALEECSLSARYRWFLREYRDSGLDYLASFSSFLNL